MKTKIRYFKEKLPLRLLWTVFCLAGVSLAMTFVLPGFVIGAEPDEPPSVTLQDCAKCHAPIVTDIDTDGASHKTEITCQNCHEGHPPRQRGIIPRCSKCHKERSHFKLKNCLQCHTNPHTPLKITLTRSLTAPCLTCHEDQIIQLREQPSIHTTLDCTACHTKHGFIPSCFACHAAHLKSMTMDDCLICHQAHMPLAVTYKDDTPSEYCGSCHTEVYQQLGQSRAKHRQVACVTCHQQKHKMIPACRSCHEEPHFGSIHQKFPKCGTCHGIAHDLKLNKNDLFIEKNHQTP